MPRNYSSTSGASGCGPGSYSIGRWSIRKKPVSLQIRRLRSTPKKRSARPHSHPALGLAELPDFMRRLAAEGQAMQSVLACRLMALTWVRTQELRFMEWGELEQGGKLWRIPEGKMKRRFEHLVPLSRQAREIIATMKARAGQSKYVFPCDAGRRQDRPMSENAVLYLIGRMGYEGRMTGHGWRSIASTWANESGRYQGDAIERQLAHTPDNKVRAAYNRAAYLGERTRMLQDWADWLDQIALDSGGSDNPSLT
jgi:integrase